MIELIIIAALVGFIWLLARAYRSYMVRKTKLKLGVAQILSDGRIVEVMERDIKTDATLPFEGRFLSSFFASYLIMRENADAGNWQGLIAAYLFKWEVEGFIRSELTDDKTLKLTFCKENESTDALELELYEALKLNHDAEFDFALLKEWSKKVLAAGEKELLETEDVAFDAKGRIRFTASGFDKSLSHGKFAKYWRKLSLSTVCELDDERLFQELTAALQLELIKDIKRIIGEDDQLVPELLKIAYRVWHF